MNWKLTSLLRITKKEPVNFLKIWVTQQSFLTPGTERGYVHSVGHGLGLNIHEMPFSGASAGDNELLSIGSVFTIEPGLYYPDEGYGIRIEDSFYVRQDGKIELFANYPYDLVLKMK